MRFFFAVTLERPDLVLPLTTSDDREQAAPSAGRAEPGGGGASARSRARPEVQSALSVAYGAGLRVSEVANLKVSGGRMSVVETFARGALPRSFKADAARIDTS